MGYLLYSCFDLFTSLFKPTSLQCCICIDIEHAENYSIYIEFSGFSDFGCNLLTVHSDGDRPKGVNTAKYIVGFICTVATSAIYRLLLPLMQLVFNVVIKKETFAVVL